MILCDRLSRMHKPMIETEPRGGEVLYKSAFGFSNNTSFEVGPVMVQPILRMTS
jgi:hypothetical protein